MQEGKYDRGERLAHIDGQYKLADTDQPADSLTPAEAETGLQKNTEMMQKAEEGREKAVIEREKIASKERQTDSQVEAQKYVSDNTVKVAKENQTKAELSASGK